MNIKHLPDVSEKEAILYNFKSPWFYLLSGFLCIWGYFISPWPMAFTFTFAFILAALTVIDFKYMVLPDSITLGGILVAIAFYEGLHVSSDALIFHQAFIFPIYAPLIGLISGFLLFFSIFYITYKIKGEPGMGFGDVKLMAMLGAFLSITGLPLVMIYSTFFALGFILLKAIFKKPLKNTPFAYGPFLCIGAWLTLLYHNSTWFFILELRQNISSWIIGS